MNMSINLYRFHMFIYQKNGLVRQLFMRRILTDIQPVQKPAQLPWIDL